MEGKFLKKLVLCGFAAFTLACSLAACSGGAGEEVERVKPEVGDFVLTQQKMPACTCGYGHEDPRECPELAGYFK